MDNPWTPGEDPPPPAAGAWSPGRMGWLGAAPLLLSAVLLPLALVSSLPGWLIAVLFGGCTILALCGAAATAWSGVFHAANLLQTAALIGLAVLNLLGAAFGALMTLFAAAGFQRGRQIHRLGRPVLSSLVSGSSWTPTSQPAVPVSPMSAAELAAAWRENGRTEHASVAAFARLTTRLMVLGAPPALVCEAQQDGLEEQRHSDLCFGLAHAIDGRDEGPSTLAAEPLIALRAPRLLALAILAIDSMIDGALNEGISARVVADLARGCPVPQVRAVLQEIARDEARHAAHAWEVLAWCLEQGGPFVRAAVRVASARLPAQIGATPFGADGGLESGGIPGAAMLARHHAETRQRVVERARRMVEVRPVDVAVAAGPA